MKKSLRPKATVRDVKEILQSFYSISIDEKNIIELNAYDDRNYWIQLSGDGKGDLLLKITNKEDSKSINVIRGQTNLLKFLSENGINCSRPILSEKGSYFFHGLEDNAHVVRLLTYLPGIVLDKAPKLENLYFKVGQEIGKLNRTMQDFDPIDFKDHSHKWMLDNCLSIREYIDVIQDKERKTMVENVLIKFENIVLSHKDKFKQGLIHGDYNENNIIVEKINDNEYDIKGVIDFGDVNYSLIVFDLAIAITYMLIHSGNIITGKYVLLGYKSERSDLNIEEKNILAICVQARLCQSLVNGAFAFSQDPDNKYVLSSQSTGWDLLKILYNTSNDQILDIWDE